MLNEASDMQVLAEKCRLVESAPIFVIGTFDERITVLSQQRRALNLACSLIETDQIPTLNVEKSIRIAIIGAGFAGLTFAAALLQKRCRCDITVFEERDTLLPLQQGSDTRWLHPHIYDWPEEGSESAAAMLPVLNWTAARASDVVVQILSGWADLLDQHADRELKLYCNTRHLQIQSSSNKSAVIEWVGEQRNPIDGSAFKNDSGAVGQSEQFELVVLAVGFGLEINSPLSYWRNEVLAQPSLTQPQRTFLVSGQGDGALIDMFRLKISQFRQDRILSELFQGKGHLVEELRKLRVDFLKKSEDVSLFPRFDALRRQETSIGEQMRLSIDQLRKRHRRDTEIILGLKARNIDELLTSKSSRTSFQNALLVYLLYMSGGFAPSRDDELKIVERFGISPENVIRRHGTERLNQLERLLPEEIFKSISDQWEVDRCAKLQQASEILWEGGYFGTPGHSRNFGQVDDSARKTWRKEYLPGPTSLVALGIAGSVAGALASFQPNASHFRVTVHRVLTIYGEELLQQACDYVGRGLVAASSTSGRTFPAKNATIGVAYLTRRIIRSRSGITPDELIRVMKELNLNQASREMASEVGFLAAIPIVQPDNDFYEPSPVSAIVYIDSRDSGFNLTNDEMGLIKVLVESVVESVRLGTNIPLDRLENTPLRRRVSSPKVAATIPASVKDALIELYIEPPQTERAFTLNYDHSDLTPIAGGQPAINSGLEGESD